MNWKILWRKRDVLTPTEAARKRRVYIFTVCVFCSALFWLFIKLSQESQASFEQRVMFDAFPEGHLGVAQSDSVFRFTMETSGIRLIWARFFLNKDLMRFDADDLPSVTRNNVRYLYVTQSSLSEHIERSLEGRVAVTDARPDTVFVELAPALTKKIPVQLRADISFDRRYAQYGEIAIEPDSIQVVGPQSVLDTLPYVYTEFWETGRLRRNTEKVLALETPGDLPFITLETREVAVHVPVEEYTEASIGLNLQMECPEGVPHYDVRLFPNTVTVTYTVALRDYHQISREMFRAVVNCPQIEYDTDGRLEVRLENYPWFVDVLHYRPRFVEYIILE